MDQISENKLADVMPLLADKIRKLAKILENEGIYIRVTQGLRTWEEQDALYAQGRTAPGKVVTNAKGGQSWHNFGMAVDVCPSTQGMSAAFTPDWDVNHPCWRRMIEVGTQLGMNSGATWRTFKDWPHFQITGRFPVGEPNQEAIELFKYKGMLALWDQLQEVKP